MAVAGVWLKERCWRNGIGLELNFRKDCRLLLFQAIAQTAFLFPRRTQCCFNRAQSYQAVFSGKRLLKKKKKTVDRILLSRGHAEPIHLRSRPLKGRVMAMSSIQGQTCGYFQGGFLGGYVRSQSRPGVRGAAVSMLRSCWQIQTLTRVSGLSDMNGS